MEMTEEGGDLCAFCRTPRASSGEEIIKRFKELMDKSNGDSFNALGSLYRRGYCGLAQDYRKANELYLKAGELGCANAYYNLGINYENGDGVEIDTNKTQHYWELAAMKGDVLARYNLGHMEHRAGNHQRAMKHFILAANAGFKLSLDIVMAWYKQGFVTKEEYASTLRLYHERQKEMKSDERDKAVASDMFSRAEAAASGLFRNDHREDRLFNYLCLQL